MCAQSPNRFPSRLREGLGEGLFQESAAFTHPLALLMSSSDPCRSFTAAITRPMSLRLLAPSCATIAAIAAFRSEEHTSELQSLMRISYAVFCLNKNKNNNIHISVTGMRMPQTNPLKH